MTAPRPHTTAAPKNSNFPGLNGGKSSLGLCQALESFMKISGRGSPAQSPSGQRPRRGGAGANDLLFWYAADKDAGDHQDASIARTYAPYLWQTVRGLAHQI